MSRRPRLILSGAVTVVAAGLLAATVTYFTGAKAAGLPAVGRVIPPRSGQRDQASPGPR